MEVSLSISHAHWRQYWKRKEFLLLKRAIAPLKILNSSHIVVMALQVDKLESSAYDSP
jgi:hypothetical protein